MKYIFENTIETENIYVAINKTFDDHEEREQLITIVKDVIHHKVVDLVLDELDDEKKLVFMAKLNDESQHRDILTKLSAWIEDFETKVVAKVKETEQELVELFNK